MKSLCLAVPKREGERIRKELLDRGLLRTDLEIIANEERLYLPISGASIDLRYEIKEMDFRESLIRTGDYRRLLRLPHNLELLLPKSMDIVGDVAIMKMPEELDAFKHEIGEAIVKAKNVRAVALDRGVKGDLRMRDLEFVIGAEKTSTVHREYGLWFELDLKKVYFSPRLATERRRVASQVKDGEVVLDMFCGIGPFSIMIAKYSNPKKIYAVDINHEAIEYLKKNVLGNKVADKIVPILGNSKDVVKRIEKVDRIIMNLPLSSFQFFGDALYVAKNGCTIHYYEVLHREKVEERLDELKRAAMKKELEIAAREVKSYSSTNLYYAFDIKVRG